MNPDELVSPKIPDLQKSGFDLIQFPAEKIE